MFGFLAGLTTFLFFLPIISRLTEIEDESHNHVRSIEDEEDLANGGSLLELGYVWTLVGEYGYPLAQVLIQTLNKLHRRFTFGNATIFLLMHLPIGWAVYKLIKGFYVNSKNWMKEKQMELEDIKLQIQIVNTKLSVYDAELSERMGTRAQRVERLQALRARVRDEIASDGALCRLLDTAAHWAADTSANTQLSSEDEHNLMMSFKLDRLLKGDRTSELEDIENPPPDQSTPDDSVYSSMSDDCHKDCHIKIVKVTNVYKLAYLKHYIKQKKLRRANKQALLKKKTESIIKLLEDWQKSLNMVINSKLSLIDTSPLDVISQDAMGDYSKTNFRDLSDSDSDNKTTGTEMSYDDYALSWTQNYRPYPYYEDIPETNNKDMIDSPSYCDMGFTPPSPACECNVPKGTNVLFILPEETNSQIAIEELASDAGVDDD